MTTTRKSLSMAFAAPGLTASATSRTIGGIGIRYGVPGRTSAGKLRVLDPAALTYAEHVILTREHLRDEPRGVLSSLAHTDEGTRVTFKVADGTAGDDALREAADGTRRGLSFDVVDAVIDGDVITAGHVIAFGQVAIPAFDHTRIDHVAASTTTPGDTAMTPEQTARLLELQTKSKESALTEEEDKEFKALTALAEVYPPTAAPAPAPEPAAAVPATAGLHITVGTGLTAADTAKAQEIAASIPAVPGGVPGLGTSATTTKPVTDGAALAKFFHDITAGLQSKSITDITAALADITHSAHTSKIEAPAWSGELFSGTVYEPVWSDLFNTAPLTSWAGQGWRFTDKMEISDYAGDKTPIPTDTVTTESSTYSASRMAVGVDVDRKFFDFPNEGFVQALFEQIRESWAIKLDAKVSAHTLAKVVKVPQGTGATPAADLVETSLLRAAGRAIYALRQRRVGQASWVMVNDLDLFRLLDITTLNLPQFLDVFNIEPRNFRSAPEVPAGTVIAGVRQAATLRTLPGSPIRVDAQDLARGGVDTAAFGYWAMEEHHKSGIASVKF